MKIRTEDFKKFNYVITRNPIDMAEGGGVQDNSSRLEYLATAKQMQHNPLPMPVNQAVITSFEGLRPGVSPMFKPSNLTAMDTNFYSGLLSINDQPTEKTPSAFSTSGTPKGDTDL